MCAIPIKKNLAFEDTQDFRFKNVMSQLPDLVVAFADIIFQLVEVRYEIAVCEVC